MSYMQQVCMFGWHSKYMPFLEGGYAIIKLTEP
jgi:hypothetical protein